MADGDGILRVAVVAAELKHLVAAEVFAAAGHAWSGSSVGVVAAVVGSLVVVLYVMQQLVHRKTPLHPLRQHQQVPLEVAVAAEVRVVAGEY